MNTDFKKIFDDKYFKNLYENIMKRVDGKKVYVKDMYIFEKEMLASECKPIVYEKVNLIGKIFGKEENEVFSYNDLFKNKGFKVSPILIYDDNGVYKELITGCCLPMIKFYCNYNYPNNYKFISELYFKKVINYSDSDEYYIKKMKVLSTNFAILTFKDYYWEKFCQLSVVELLKDSFLKKVASKEKIEDYVRQFSSEDNYMRLIEFFFFYSEKIKLNEYYNVPPNIPDELVSYYEKMKDSKSLSCNKPLLLTDIKSEKKVDEVIDKSLIGLEAILEIKSMIQKLDENEQVDFYKRLDDLISEYENISMGENENLGILFQQKLYKLRAEIQLCGKKSFNFEFVNKYFTYFYDISKNEFKEEELKLKVDELFRYINYFLANKKNTPFSSYFQLQELICKILTNLIVLNSSVRERVIGEVSDIYLKGIRSILSNVLNECIGKLNEGDPNVFSIYSLSFEEMKDIDYIVNGLNIIDKLDKELIKDIINQKDNKLVNVKVKK